MVDQLAHRAKIAHHKAVEIPLVTQDLRQRERIGRGRNAVERVERAHHGRRSRVDGRPIGRQVNLAQRQLGHIDGIVFATRVGRPIGREMFHARGDRVGPAQIVALVALHVGPRHRGTEPGVLARSLRNASPARIPRNIDHRGEDPADAVIGCFARGDMGDLPHQRRIEARRQRQRHRENRPLPVNHVVAEQKRNVERAFFHRQALITIGQSGADHIEQRTNLPPDDLVVVIAAPRARPRHRSG